MKTTRIVAASVLVLSMMAEAVAAQLSVSLSVDNPKKVEDRQKDDDRSYSGWSYSRDVMTKSNRQMNLQASAQRTQSLCGLCGLCV